MDNKALETILSLPAEEIAKAVKDAKGLEGIRIIKDLWEDFHGEPERNDIKTGPAMHSSGSGVDKAIDNYSNPAKQVGLAQQYDEFTEKIVEGWGKMHKAQLEAMKASSDELSAKIEAGFGALFTLLKKGEDEVEKEENKQAHEDEAKEEAKAPEAAPVDVAKSVASMWDALADLEEAYAKAESHDESMKGLDEARTYIEKAEKELEAMESKEEKEAEHKAMKAQVSINMGWRSLLKASKLSGYDLHGYGNQADEQVPGDETNDRSKHDLKGAKAKAKYYAAKVERMEKGLGIHKGEEEMEKKEEKEEHKEEAKAPEAPAPDIQTKAELANAQAELTKVTESMKAMSDRVAFLNKRVEEVTGRKMTPMSLISVKSAGLRSEELMSALNDKIDFAVDAGEMSDENGGVARSLVQRYMAVGKGYIGVDKVNLQLEQADEEVQRFFNSVETGLLQ